MSFEKRLLVIIVSLVCFYALPLAFVAFAQGCRRAQPPNYVSVNSVSSQYQDEHGVFVSCTGFGLNFIPGSNRKEIENRVFWVEKEFAIVKSGSTDDGLSGLITIDDVSHEIPFRDKTIFVINKNKMVVEVELSDGQYGYISDLMDTTDMVGKSMPTWTKDEIWMDLIGKHLLP